MRAVIALIASLTLFSCRSSREVPREQAPSAHAEPPPPAPASVPSTTCVALVSHTLGRGTDSLENVRVLQDEHRTLVTFERLSQPMIGDSSRSAHFASIDSRVDEVTLPYRAYAAAMYSYIGPTRDGAPTLFAYGLAGAPMFGSYPPKLAAWKRVDPHQGEPLPPTRTSVVDISVSEPFAVSTKSPIAVVAGQETPCESYYHCDEYAAQAQKGFDDSIRLIALETRPRSEIVWRGRLKKPGTVAPAIASGATKNAIAYRVDGRLFFSYFDAALSVEKAVTLAEGDVGAPSIAFDADSPIVVWAERASSSDPYRLRLWSTNTRLVRTGIESAFAPAVAVQSGDLLLAWMEGDAKKRGVIKLARAPLAALGADLDLTSATALSAIDGNARDPEISVSGSNAVVVWSNFAKTGESQVEVRRVSCR